MSDSRVYLPSIQNMLHDTSGIDNQCHEITLPSSIHRHSHPSFESSRLFSLPPPNTPRHISTYPSKPETDGYPQSKLPCSRTPGWRQERPTDDHSYTHSIEPKTSTLKYNRGLDCSPVLESSHQQSISSHLLPLRRLSAEALTGQNHRLMDKVASHRRATSDITSMCHPAVRKSPSSVPPNTSITNSSSLNRYRCNQCQKTFSRPSSLKIHILSHTGEKPHICPHPNCGKRFSVQSNMRRHFKVHYCSTPSSSQL